MGYGLHDAHVDAERGAAPSERLPADRRPHLHQTNRAVSQREILAGLRKTLTMLCSTEGVGYGANSLQAMTVDKGVVRIAHIDCGP
jgi:hypothetical protein